MHVTIFGSGYVGLVQAACLAEVGHDVVCVDIDAAKVERLRRGEIHIYEPGLERLVVENQAAGRLAFTTDAADGVAHGEAIFIAVGTPPGEDGSADLSHVLAVADTLGRLMTEERTVVVKSTVPVGTCDRVRAKIAEGLAARGLSGLAFDVASNPEFLKEGSAVADFMKPDRIVVGLSRHETGAVLRELYAPFNRNHEKIVEMDVRSAELTKYAANCMLATKISFMNEMANLADRLGADIEAVRKGIGSDPRIGYHFIYPGVGYGGSCFPKDIRAMIRTADEIGFDAAVLKAVEQRNERQKHFIVDKIRAHFDGDLKGRTFALWGLAFKPNTDDMREAPSRTIMEALWRDGATIRAFDPKAMPECRRIYGKRDDLVLCEGQYEALEGADALVVVTEWKSFQAPDFGRIGGALSQRTIFDGRNVYSPAIPARYGFAVIDVGRAISTGSGGR
jgi:UDPglucose 6-dehydrogenase